MGATIMFRALDLKPSSLIRSTTLINSGRRDFALPFSLSRLIDQTISRNAATLSLALPIRPVVLIASDNSALAFSSSPSFV
jgi:hypothetical protein